LSQIRGPYHKGDQPVV